MLPEDAPTEASRDALLDAVLAHVPFDGWTETSFAAAVADIGVERAFARAICPRGALDLALAFHDRGDAEMTRAYSEADTGSLRIREKIALAVQLRLQTIDDKELVRRGATLFSLPQNAAEGARALWRTSDAIWSALGDSSDDINWYTKRASLSGVYGSTVLYWLGDDSPDSARTWAFLDRRIDGVMRFEKFKAQVRGNPVLKPLLAGPEWAMRQVRPPLRSPRMGMPGYWGKEE